jgi:hypothetical protein
VEGAEGNLWRLMNDKGEREQDVNLRWVTGVSRVQSDY